LPLSITNPNEQCYNSNTLNLVYPLWMGKTHSTWHTCICKWIPTTSYFSECHDNQIYEC